jgi:hypothetical protein
MGSAASPRRHGEAENNAEKTRYVFCDCGMRSDRREPRNIALRAASPRRHGEAENNAEKTRYVFCDCGMRAASCSMWWTLLPCKPPMMPASRSAGCSVWRTQETGMAENRSSGESRDDHGARCTGGRGGEGARPGHRRLVPSGVDGMHRESGRDRIGSQRKLRYSLRRVRAIPWGCSGCGLRAGRRGHWGRARRVRGRWARNSN